MFLPILDNISTFLDTAAYRLCIGIMTIVALFTFDINIAFLPRDADVYIVIGLLCVLAVFVFDIFFSCLCRKHYFFSFYLLSYSP